MFWCNNFLQYLAMHPIKKLMSISLLSLGRNQVAVGLVPIDFANKSSESALSVYPVAIANCKEKRLVLLTTHWC